MAIRQHTRRMIVSVGVSDTRVFAPYHYRLACSLFRYGCAESFTRWKDRWPPGSPSHAEANYAFKAHALSFAAECGATSLLWLDVSCYAVAPLEPLWEHIEREGHFLGGEPQLDPETGLVDPKQPATFDSLGEWSGDLALETFGLSRDDAMRAVLLSGCCIGLDLRRERSRTFLDRLLSYATPEHFNGTHTSGVLGKLGGSARRPVSTDPRCKGHRSDEVYMALLARDLKMTSSGEFFTGGMPPKPSTVLRSGYDIAGAYKP